MAIDRVNLHSNFISTFQIEPNQLEAELSSLENVHFLYQPLINPDLRVATSNCAWRWTLCTMGGNGRKDRKMMKISKSISSINECFFLLTFFFFLCPRTYSTERSFLCDEIFQGFFSSSNRIIVNLEIRN